MKTIIIIFLVSLFSFAFLYAQDNSFNWKRLQLAVIKYENSPNKFNAMTLYSSLPSRSELRDVADTLGEHATYELAWGQIGLLDKQAISGNRYAVKLCFKLFNIADAAFAEDLDILLTKLIKKHPKLFLQELKNHRHLFGTELDFLNFGEEFVDVDAKVLKKEIDLHIRALQSIKDSSLIDIRDEMINEYKSYRNSRDNQ